MPDDDTKDTGADTGEGGSPDAGLGDTDPFEDAFEEFALDKPEGEDSGDDTKDTETSDEEEVKPEDQKTEPGDTETAKEVKAQEDWEQKYKTLQGMFNKTDEELKTIKQSQQEASQKKDDTEKAEKKEADLSLIFKDLTKDLDKELRTELENYESQFDTVSKMENVKRELTAKRIVEYVNTALKTFLERVNPVLEKTAEQVQTTHYDRLRAAHADFENLRDTGEIKTWILEQPKYLQPALVQAYQNGDTTDVIDLITRYKKEKGISNNTEDNTHASKDKTKEERIQNLSVVKNKNRGINTNTGKKVDPNDFDGAFEEAASKGK